MSSLTLAQATSLRDEYVKAELACLKNQSYTIGTRTYTRATLSSLRKGRQDAENLIKQLSRSGAMRPRRVLYRDD